MSEQFMNLKIFILLIIKLLKLFYTDFIGAVIIFLLPISLAYFLLNNKKFKKFILHSFGFIFLSAGFNLMAIHILNLWFIPEEIQIKYVDNIHYGLSGFLAFFMYLNLYLEYKDLKKDKDKNI